MPQGIDSSRPPSAEKSPRVKAKSRTAAIAAAPIPDTILASFIQHPPCAPPCGPSLSRPAREPRNERSGALHVFAVPRLAILQGLFQHADAGDTHAQERHH